MAVNNRAEEERKKDDANPPFDFLSLSDSKVISSEREGKNP